MSKQAQAIAAIKQLALADDNIAIVWLYGSRARDNYSDDSDYDLAIAFNRFLSDPLESRLRPEELAIVWKNTLGVDLSIVDINKAPIALSMTVITDNCPLVINDHLRFANEEQRIMSRWEIDNEFDFKFS